MLSDRCRAARLLGLLAALTPIPLAWPATGLAQTAATTPEAAAPLVLPQVEVTGAASGRPSTSAPDVRGFVAHADDTATRTNTSLLETPQSLHVVTRDQIDQQNAQTVRTLLRYLPGVYYSNDANNRLDGILVRGFQPDQYLDGLRLIGGTWAVPKVEPFLLERAQLLLGPSSVLYGQGSPGGLLNLESRVPPDAAVHHLQLQGGTWNTWRGSFDLGGALNQDRTLFGRITGTATTSETQVDHQREQRVAIAPSLSWRPNADTTLTVLGSYLYDPYAGFWNQLPYQGTLLPNRYGPLPRDFFVGDDQYEHFTRQQAMIGYQFWHRFDDTWSVTQNLRYTQINTDYREIQGSSLLADQRTLTRNAYSSDENLNTLAIDTRAQARFATWMLDHTVLLGVDYQHSNWRNLTRFGTAPSLDIVNPDYHMAALGRFLPPPLFQNARQTQNQLGGYVQDQIRFGGWTLLLAGRWDAYTNRTLNRLNGVTTDSSATHATGHIGLNYVFANGIAPYVSYATSFQPVAGVSRTGESFRPTTGTQYEAGIRYQPPDLNALFTAAIFDLRQDNVSTTDPVNTLFLVQTGQVRSRGLELSATASPLPGLNLRAAYTYLETEITRSNVPGTVGRRQPNVPQNIASLFASYSFQDRPLRGLTLGGGLRYTGTAYTTQQNTQRMPGYTTVDALVSYDLGAMTDRLRGAVVSVNAQNIFNKRYESTCSVLGCYYGVGRQVTASLDFSW
ncbi:MAG TPA: TonB-dependent siderophore receptor [Roseomonas sp.]|jgi:iron complex outermembrane receptor protein